MRASAVAVWLLITLLTAGPLLAGPSGEVDVRVFDAGGEVLVDTSLVMEQRLEIEGAPEHLRYLGLRRERFRGQQVLEISLADRPDTWERMSYAAWNQPSLQIFGGVRFELVPRGWARRYCRELASIDSPVERDPSVSVRVNDGTHLSESGWNGRELVNLRSLSASEAEPQWQARVDGDGRLQIRPGRLGSWRTIDSVRDDFLMVRHLWHEAGRLQVTHEPAAYGKRFCDRYNDQGERYAKAIADHVFGRNAGGVEDGAD